MNLLHLNIHVRPPDFGLGPYVLKSGGPQAPPDRNIEFRALYYDFGEKRIGLIIWGWVEGMRRRRGGGWGEVLVEEGLGGGRG